MVRVQYRLAAFALAAGMALLLTGGLRPAMADHSLFEGHIRPGGNPPPHWLYVVEGSGEVLTLVDLRTGARKSYRIVPVGKANVGQPLADDIAVDDAGRIYLADARYHRIIRMDDISGRGWVEFGTFGPGSGEFNTPRGVSVTSSGAIYVADCGNNRIVGFRDMTGAGWRALGTRGWGLGQFECPHDITLDASNRIFVADYSNARIVRMDNLSGDGWRQTHVPLLLPNAVAVDAMGHIYAADHGTGKIVVVDPANYFGSYRIDVGGPDVFVERISGHHYLYVPRRWEGTIAVMDQFGRVLAKIQGFVMPVAVVAK